MNAACGKVAIRQLWTTIKHFKRSKKCTLTVPRSIFSFPPLFFAHPFGVMLLLLLLRRFPRARAGRICPEYFGPVVKLERQSNPLWMLWLLVSFAVSSPMSLYENFPKKGLKSQDAKFETPFSVLDWICKIFCNAWKFSQWANGLAGEPVG